eukprot:gnl/MRDRNA2_/MRDRNA2_205727_c0_seq1.p1 gnl/MRDRNA2_/MRDRNA2_205727_c0~~gnl/MRDRNA2_/MRDRNA2_205727_c0_seq1.p1  ORF type:complete len:195 (+),score=40.84 gnl/MRDRNA2_/MRDRNA2_205727_c0_seq1:59-643(+)
MKLVAILAVVLSLQIVQIHAAASKEKESSAQRPGALITWDGVVNLSQQTWWLIKDAVVFMMVQAHDRLPPGSKRVVADAMALQSDLSTQAEALYEIHAKDYVDNAKLVLTRGSSIATDAAAEPVSKLNDVLNDSIEGFERRYPSSKGAIPTGALDKAALGVYLMVFILGCWRVLGLLRPILCCALCCGCCCARI